MSVPKGVQERAIAASRDVNTGSRDLHIIYVFPDFLDGNLVVVEGIDGSGEQFLNHVYLAGSRVRVAKNDSQFAHLVAEESKRISPFSEIMRVGGISGVIAIIITVTICYMFVGLRVTEVPIVLSTSLSTILGFYFGTRVTRDR